ncbi:Hypothetical predicted protein [Olea europaea subsp. europaea]|uniref:Uncharacterized protein n=1 Tax=Olea europaea subsp. europaea TaxID=158383 RepID=A0A8S0QC43_OLEEU|nr:Hypothetical predicted protein [Olea europaea subsp. europaea]
MARRVAPAVARVATTRATDRPTGRVLSHASDLARAAPRAVSAVKRARARECHEAAGATQSFRRDGLRKLESSASPRLGSARLGLGTNWATERTGNKRPRWAEAHRGRQMAHNSPARCAAGRSRKGRRAAMRACRARVTCE